MSADDPSDEEGFEPTDEQAAVIESDLDAGHNIAITAGAGTGKTTTLTERYVRILEETDATPEEIITITFTNDAANELRRRIRRAVDERLSEASASSAAFERWRSVRDDLTDGYIHTIHGLCSRLLREHVAEAPVPPEFEVYDESDAQLLAQETVHDSVADRLAAGDGDVVRLANLWDRSTLEEVLTGLLAERPRSEQWADRWADATPEEYMDFVWESFDLISPELAEETFANSVFRDALSTIQQLRADGILDHIDPEVDSGADHVAVLTALLDEHEPLRETATTRDRQWFLDAVCVQLTSNSDSTYSQDHYYCGKGSRWADAGYEDEQAELLAAINAIIDALQPDDLNFGVRRDRTAAHYKLALARVFEDVLVDYEAAKADANVLDYNDLIETAIKFLEDNPGIRRRRREEFSHVMVDEVQDTDPRQWELVQLLTSESQASFDGDNVLLVGDEKQSIYRFRGADVTSFADARRELAGANPEGVMTERPLTGNFRTTEETLAFCNEFFQDLFQPLQGTDHEPYEATPQELSTERRNGTDIEGAIEYLLVPDSDVEALHGPDYLEEAPAFTDSGDREAHAIAARITRLLADPPMVYDEGDDEYRAAEPEDITILLRSRSRLKSYERALDRQDIPYAVASGTGFYESPEVTTVLNLLRVIEDPTNERALYGVLRSPLFGIPDEDLVRLRTGMKDVSLWTALGELESEPDSDSSEAAGDGSSSLSPRAEWSAALVDARECLERWRRVAGTAGDLDPDAVTPWGTLLSQVIEETGYLASVAGDERPRQAAVNVEQLREQLRSWEEAGIKTAGELVERIETRQEVESHTPEATIPEDTDGVEIRTIHSAKGLEFNIVVVPEMGTQFNFGAEVDEHGRAYFEELDLGTDNERETDRTPVLAIKSPGEADPYEAESTFVREMTIEQMRSRDRAELKRLLYVAATRARDHLILSGEHQIVETDDGYVLDEVKAAHEALRWSDWVQPILLEDDTDDRGSDGDADENPLLSELGAAGRASVTLDESGYDVVIPHSPVENWRTHGGADADVEFGIDIPSIERRHRQRTVTATGYADLVGDADHGVGPEGDAETDDGEVGDENGLSATTLGDIVHRICEQRPPRERWRPYALSVARREGGSLTETDFERVEAYARRGIEFVDDYESARSVQTSHDELSVVARFAQARLVGDIDHLVVTDEGFHIIDYKTNDLSRRNAEELAEYYLHQMRAYAVALYQADQERDVRATLLFTDEPRAVSECWQPPELSTLSDTLNRRLQCVSEPTQVAGGCD